VVNARHHTTSHHASSPLRCGSLHALRIHVCICLLKSRAPSTNLDESTLPHHITTTPPRLYVVGSLHASAHPRLHLPAKIESPPPPLHTAEKSLVYLPPVKVERKRNINCCVNVFVCAVAGIVLLTSPVLLISFPTTQREVQPYKKMTPLASTTKLTLIRRCLWPLVCLPSSTGFRGSCTVFGYMMTMSIGLNPDT
jgi:hypothetical protein